MATRGRGAAAAALLRPRHRPLQMPTSSSSPLPPLCPHTRCAASYHTLPCCAPRLGITPSSSPFHGFSIRNEAAFSLRFSPLPNGFVNAGWQRKATVCGLRWYKDGRPRGPLWRGKKMVGKEALLVVLGLKLYKHDKDRLAAFVKSHVHRLLKMDKIAVLNELERQEEVELALMVFNVIQKDDWYKPDVYIYKDLIISLAKCKRMEEAMEIWEDMKKANLFPDGQTYTEVIRGFLRNGSPSDAMNIYEDMKNSPEPPEEMPFRILLKGLLPYPLLRNRVKQDFEELFPEKHIYDPPEEIFGLR